MIAGFFDGVASYIRALGVLGSYGLSRYLLMTGIGGLIIGLLVIYGIYVSYDDLGELLAGLWPWEWGSTSVSYIADGLTVVSMIFIFFFIYKYIIFILLAPLLSIISQKVESHVRGEVSVSGINVFGEMIRGLRINLRNIIRELVLTILLLIISVIMPWLAWLTGTLIFLVQAYYAGFGNMDYTLERYYSTVGSVSFVKRHQGFAIGNGIIFLVLLPIPVLGMFLAPFFGAVGATLGTLDRLDREGQ